ncbi:MAG: IPT/TIG domain-containing protein [Flavisolibacter sp.]
MKCRIPTNCLIILCFVVFACSKKSGDTNSGGGNNPPPPPPPPPNSAGFSITSTSPQHPYWGEELTIVGTGFSTNKNDYSFKFRNDVIACNLNAFELISASSTELKIKMPIGTNPSNGRKCGPFSDQVIVTANGKSDTTNAINFLGWPRLQGVCTHFGGWAGDYIIPGDSVAMNMAGATGIFASVNNNNTNAVLEVDGINIPIKWRNYSACFSGLGGVITLEKEKFAKLKCTSDPDWGNGGRMLKFKISNPGTNRFDSASYFVEWLPSQNFSSFSGSPNISMSAGGFPTWTIKGKNMTYLKARFTATNCSLTTQEVAINKNGDFYDEGTFPIPLSVMTIGCNYSVSIINHCGQVRVLGGVQIKP